jgi:hypothetical protein
VQLKILTRGQMRARANAVQNIGEASQTRAVDLSAVDAHADHKTPVSLLINPDRRGNRF